MRRARRAVDFPAVEAEGATTGVALDTRLSCSFSQDLIPDKPTCNTPELKQSKIYMTGM